VVVDDGRSEDVICTNSRVLNDIKLEQLMNGESRVRVLWPPFLVRGGDDETTEIDKGLVEKLNDASRDICNSAGGNGQAAGIPDIVVDRGRRRC